MESAGAGPRFTVRVVDEVLAKDLAHCKPAARSAIEPMITKLRLGGCVKLYIPQPVASGVRSSPPTMKLARRPWF